MKISKKNLVNALQKVAPGLATKDEFDQYTHFAFMGSRIVTYNDEISVSCEVEGMDITGAVSSKELYALLSQSKMKSDDLNFIVSESEIKIKAGKGRAGLRLYKDTNFPLGELGEIEDWKKLPDNLLEIMNFCRFSCSTNNNRPILTCVHVTPEYVEACDNSRLTRHIIPGKEKMTEKLLIPSKTVQHLQKYRMDTYSLTRGWVHFRTSDESVIFSCRVFEEQFPNTDAIANVEEGFPLVLPADLSQSLDMAGIFSVSELHTSENITVRLSAGKALITSENSEGWYKESFKVDYEGESIGFDINPSFLKEMLRKTDACLVTPNRMKFEGEGWQYIVGFLVSEEE